MDRARAAPIGALLRTATTGALLRTATTGALLRAAGPVAACSDGAGPGAGSAAPTTSAPAPEHYQRTVSALDGLGPGTFDGVPTP